jgi:hypothetical protein
MDPRCCCAWIGLFGGLEGGLEQDGGVAAYAAIGKAKDVHVGVVPGLEIWVRFT